MRPDRRERIRTALHRRLGRVRCAIESLYHRHNVSAVLRTCDALGLQHVHLVEGRFVPSQGAARGAERWLTLHHHVGPEEALAELKRDGVALWVADLAEDGAAPEQVPVDRPVCLWFGAELAGVSEEARAAADGVLTLPMRGFAQSLNVSVAAAMALHTVAERARALGDEALLPPEERDALWKAWMAREEPHRRGLETRAALGLDTPE